MTLQTVEGRSACQRSRPSEIVHRQIDTSEHSTDHRVVQRLSRRYGISPEVAALVAELSGLGPREGQR